MRRLSTWLVLPTAFGFVLSGAPASARDLWASAYGGPVEVLVGVKLVHLRAFGADGREAGGPRLGAGAFLERALLGGALEIEINFAAVPGGAGVAVPIAALIKRSFQLGKQAAVYAGAGPTVSIESLQEGGVRAGMTAVVGAYLWITERWGLDLDLEYGFRWNAREGFGSEMAVAIGPVARF